jgi:hypothetical protein
MFRRGIWYKQIGQNNRRTNYIYEYDDSITKVTEAEGVKLVLYAYVQGASIFKLKFNSKQTRNVNVECNLIIFIHVSRPDCSTESTRKLHYKMP